MITKHIFIRRSLFRACRLPLILLTLLTLDSCTKLVEVDVPKTISTGENVYSHDASAAAVLTGIYIQLAANPLYAGTSLKSFLGIYPGLSSDEFNLFDGALDSKLNYYRNQLTGSTYPNIWNVAYGTIYAINSAIEGLEGSHALTPAVKQQLLGEAKFLRAFHYFYLTNLCGRVPLVLTADYKVNARLPRSEHAEVYAQIIADLTDAEDKLSAEYKNADALTASEDKVRPNKWAATALLARVYLYQQRYADAVETASKVLESGQYDTVALDKVFLLNSPEAIWQLPPVNFGHNTEEAQFFVMQTTEPSEVWPATISESLLGAFEPADQRKSQWIGSVTHSSNTYYFPFKYKSYQSDDPILEYSMMMRLAELYLIRAEANAYLNNFSGALADLNMIRHRAGLPDYSGTVDEPGIAAAILHERQIEFFAEMGHRWFDLKRSGTADAVMSQAAAAKGADWQATDTLYPILQSDIILNPNLEQNPGY